MVYPGNESGTSVPMSAKCCRKESVAMQKSTGTVPHCKCLLVITGRPVAYKKEANHKSVNKAINTRFGWFLTSQLETTK